MERFGLGETGLEWSDPAPSSSRLEHPGDALTCEVEPTPLPWSSYAGEINLSSAPGDAVDVHHPRPDVPTRGWVITEVHDPWRDEQPASAARRAAGAVDAHRFGCEVREERRGPTRLEQSDSAPPSRNHDLSNWTIAMDGIVDPWANDGASDADRLGVELIVDPWRPRL